eukprot:g5261.t1
MGSSQSIPPSFVPEIGARYEVLVDERWEPAKVVASSSESVTFAIDRTGKEVAVSNAENVRMAELLLRRHAEVDVLDFFISKKTQTEKSKWRPATVVEVDMAAGKSKVAFEGWSEVHDIWLDHETEPGKPKRYAARGTHTGSRSGSGKRTGSTTTRLCIGKHIECKDYFKSKKTGRMTSKWRSAEIVDFDETKGWKVHYAGWKSTWDEFIPPSDVGDRIREVEASSLSTAKRAAEIPLQDRADAKRAALQLLNGGQGHDDASMVLKGHGRVGIENLGNTCFMASTLQCLLNIPSIALYFGQKLELKEINPSSPTRGLFATSFGDLVREYWSATTTTTTTTTAAATVRPTQLKRIVGRFVSMFSGYAQNDAQEFLRFFLDALHDDLNRILEKPSYEEIDDSGLDQKALGEVYWRNYEERNSSHIKDIFCGQLKSVVTCGQCSAKSSSFDPFWDLSLSLPAGRKRCTIEECMKSFSEPETLDGTEKYFCKSCKKHTRASKTMSIERWPPIVVLHIKRLLPRKRLSTSVDIDETEVLDLGKMAGGLTTRYSLMGQVNHIGSRLSGHYTADVKSAKDGMWNGFSDAEVMDPEIGSSRDGSYLLFYAAAL